MRRYFMFDNVEIVKFNTNTRYIRGLFIKHICDVLRVLSQVQHGFESHYWS